MDWNTLRSCIRGTVVTQNDAQFLSAKKAMVWNELKPERSPEVIVTVQDEEDVVKAINFARENGLQVVVHGGGHTWCGLALRHGGMTIDLSGLTQSWIDKESYVKLRLLPLPILKKKALQPLVF